MRGEIWLMGCGHLGAKMQDEEILKRFGMLECWSATMKCRDCSGPANYGLSLTEREVDLAARWRSQAR